MQQPARESLDKGLDRARAATVPPKIQDVFRPNWEIGEEAEGAPEMYAFQAPEGYEFLVQRDQKLFDQYTPIFRELGLSNAQAEKLVHEYVRATEGR